MESTSQWITVQQDSAAPRWFLFTICIGFFLGLNYDAYTQLGGEIYIKYLSGIGFVFVVVCIIIFKSSWEVRIFADESNIYIEKKLLWRFYYRKCVGYSQNDRVYLDMPYRISGILTDFSRARGGTVRLCNKEGKEHKIFANIKDLSECKKVLQYLEVATGLRSEQIL